MSRHLIFTAGVVAAALSLGACNTIAGAGPAASEEFYPMAAAELAPPLIPSGSRRPVARAGGAALQSYANVVQIEDFSEQIIHLFGVRDGVSNTVKVYARLSSIDDDWAVFPIAEAFSYKVVSVQYGAIGIELTKSSDGPDGNPIYRTDRIIVEWTDATDLNGPATLTITPAACPERPETTDIPCGF